jgi:hypothetical protein
VLPADAPAELAAEREGKQADKLAAVGLIAKRERATVAGFIESYIKGRSGSCTARPPETPMNIG